MKPFRWNIIRREQLGRLTEGELASVYAGFESHLRVASARIISAAGDADLCFVGRSPESLFDYLSGVLPDTSWQDRLLLANISIRYASITDIRRDSPDALPALQDHLSQLGLLPTQLVARRRPVALIDLVSSGSTFRHLGALIMELANDAGADLPGVRRKLRFVGITWKTKNSPHTYRWHQHADWLNEFPRIKVKNVSISGEMWAFLGNMQEKVTPTNPPWRWSDQSILSPPRDKSSLKALRRAASLFDLGNSPDERDRFSAELSRQHSMRYRWCRRLVSELRGRSSS